MTRRCSALGVCLCVLAGCQGETKANQAARVSSMDGVINLLTIEKMDAGATLAIHHGVFQRRGNCLVLEAGGAGATPVFSADAGVAVDADSIRVAGLDFKFGETVALPGLGPSYAGEPVGQCPTARRLVRGVEAAIRPRRPG